MAPKSNENLGWFGVEPDETSNLARPICSNCDRVGVPGARFCSNCGQRLDENAMAEATGVLSELELDEPIETARPSESVEHGAVLVVYKGPDSGTRFPLTEDLISVGRAPECDVFLDDVTVSRHHAEFLHGSEGWLIRDLKSLNGTYVNRNRVDQHRLQQGDEVQIGKYRFHFWSAE